MIEDKRYQNILYCSDFSHDANFAFSHVLEQCEKHQSCLHIMHVIISPDSYRGPVVDNNFHTIEMKDPELKQAALKEQVMLSLRLHYESKLKTLNDYRFVVDFGSPDVTIINYSKENDIDMIVLGVVGQIGGKHRKMLRTAANVSKYAACQVVTIGVSEK